MNFDITNILTALIARRYGWNVSKFIVGNNEVTEMILTNNTKDFNLVKPLQLRVFVCSLSQPRFDTESARNIA